MILSQSAAGSVGGGSGMLWVGSEPEPAGLHLVLVLVLSPSWRHLDRLDRLDTCLSSDWTLEAPGQLDEVKVQDRRFRLSVFMMTSS